MQQAAYARFHAALAARQGQRAIDSAGDTEAATWLMCLCVALGIGLFIVWLGMHGAFAPALWAGDVS